MILKKVFSQAHNSHIDIAIENTLISDIGHNLSGINEIYFDNAVVFPGLINSHDHLDFNLFPKLGNSKFKNYTEWGPILHSKYATEIDTVMKIPANQRYHFGILKNLVGGVTTVIHHGFKTYNTQFPIRVIDQFQHLHSVHFEKYWKLRLNNPFSKRQLCVIHSGEGTDSKALKEVRELVRFNFLKRKLVGVHGVSMTREMAKHFAALVWCPQSNEFMFGKTADVEIFKDVTPILFGTDSTLTSDWNIWNHIRDARRTHKLNDDEIVQSLTTNAANIWNIDSGSIKVGKLADIIIAENKSNDPKESFFQLNPENLLLVICNGKVVLADESMRNVLHSIERNHLSSEPLLINGRIKFVPAEFVNTIREIKKISKVSIPFKLVTNVFTD